MDTTWETTGTAYLGVEFTDLAFVQIARSSEVSALGWAFMTGEFPL